MQLSNYALQQMGLLPILEGDIVAGVFYSINVYQIRGLITEACLPEPLRGHFDGVSYVLNFGPSVNSICQQLIGELFVKDESEWQSDRRCSPPYLVVVFGPTQVYRANGRNYSRQTEDGGIVTYDSFAGAKADLKEREEAVLPRLLPAISCCVSSVNRPTKIKAIDYAVAGLSTDGKTIQDIQITGFAEVYTSWRVSQEEVTDKLSDAIALAGKLNIKVSRLYNLGLFEDDLLKKFLYLFLAIEIETHATFGAIDHAKMMSEVLILPQRADASAKQLFDKTEKNWRSLKDRFVWCVICAWTSLTDTDVEEFTKIKEIRDKIAHGSISSPPGWAVISAEILAAKLQQAKM